MSDLDYLVCPETIPLNLTSGCWSSSGELTENQPTTPPRTARKMRRVPPPAAMASFSRAAWLLRATITTVSLSLSLSMSLSLSLGRIKLS